MLAERARCPTMHRGPAMHLPLGEDRVAILSGEREIVLDEALVEVGGHVRQHGLGQVQLESRRQRALAFLAARAGRDGCRWQRRFSRLGLCSSNLGPCQS